MSVTIHEAKYLTINTCQLWNIYVRLTMAALCKMSSAFSSHALAFGAYLWCLSMWPHVSSNTHPEQFVLRGARAAREQEGEGTRSIWRVVWQRKCFLSTWVYCLWTATPRKHQLVSFKKRWGLQSRDLDSASWKASCFLIRLERNSGNLWMLICTIYSEVVECLVSLCPHAKWTIFMRPYLVFASDQQHLAAKMQSCLSFAFFMGWLSVQERVQTSLCPVARQVLHNLAWELCRQ